MSSRRSSRRSSSRRVTRPSSASSAWGGPAACTAPGGGRHYGLTLGDVRSMEHALTYQALTSGAVDVIDVFSTDGQLARFDLVVLGDDRRFFPDYAAVLLVRASLPLRLQRTWGVL